MHIPTFLATGPLTPGTSYVRLTAASGTNIAHLDQMDILIASIHFQADSGNNAVMTIQYGGEEVGLIAVPAATGELPIVNLECPGGFNSLNLKNFTIKGDSDDKVRVWMFRQ